jgi:glutamate/tyrosine decarboxylase-like PLP-dependent enzyme
LYAPLEAGCTLVKNPQHLIDTFSSHPEYYNFAKNEKDPSRNFYEFGLQNSRGFRALKVWLAFQQVGKNGYMNMIREDIQLSEYMYDLARNHSEIQAMTQNLSITTFRYVPSTIDQHNSSHLNTLNEALLDELQTGGEVFLSNAIIDNLYCLRACIVNFRTSKKDVDEIFEIIIRVGKKVQQRLQSKNN